MIIACAPKQNASVESPPPPRTASLQPLELEFGHVAVDTPVDCDALLRATESEEPTAWYRARDKQGDVQIMIAVDPRWEMESRGILHLRRYDERAYNARSASLLCKVPALEGKLAAQVCATPETRLLVVDARGVVPTGADAPSPECCALSVMLGRHEAGIQTLWVERFRPTAWRARPGTYCSW